MISKQEQKIFQNSILYMFSFYNSIFLFIAQLHMNEIVSYNMALEILLYIHLQSPLFPFPYPPS